MVAIKILYYIDLWLVKALQVMGNSQKREATWYSKIFVVVKTKATYLQEKKKEIFKFINIFSAVIVLVSNKYDLLFFRKSPVLFLPKGLNMGKVFSRKNYTTVFFNNKNGSTYNWNDLQKIVSNKQEFELINKEQMLEKHPVIVFVNDGYIFFGNITHSLGYILNNGKYSNTKILPPYNIKKPSYLASDFLLQHNTSVNVVVKEKLQKSYYEKSSVLKITEQAVADHAKEKYNQDFQHGDSLEQTIHKLND